MELYASSLWHLKHEVDLSVLAESLHSSAPLRPEGLCALASVMNLAKNHESAMKFLLRAVKVSHTNNWCSLIRHFHVKTWMLSQGCRQEACRVISWAEEVASTPGLMMWRHTPSLLPQSVVCEANHTLPGEHCSWRSLLTGNTAHRKCCEHCSQEKLLMGNTVHRKSCSRECCSWGTLLTVTRISWKIANQRWSECQ